MCAYYLECDLTQLTF